MLHSGLTGQVLRAFHRVYAELGVGYLESVYEGAMELVLQEAGLSIGRQVPLDVMFHGRRIGEFRADLVVEGRVLVELKASRVLAPVHEAQVINYLRSSSIEVGLLLNFGARPEFKRLVFSSWRKQPRVGPRSGPPRSSAANIAERQD